MSDSLSPALVDEEPGIKLKVDGKRFTCTGQIPTARMKAGALLPIKKLCKSASFEAHFETGPLTAGAAFAVYRCLTCRSVHSWPADSVEELLPARNDWQTPQVFWEQLHLEYCFDLDAAASAANAKCPRFFDGLTPETDGLRVAWGHEARAFWNPPYNPKGSVATWLGKALAEAANGVFSVGLLPMATSVAWFNDLVVPFCEWHTFRGRVAFDDPLAKPGEERTSPKQDNLLVIIDPASCVIGHTAVRDSRTGARLWGALDDDDDKS